MFEYLKKLQYPVNIKKGNAKLASYIISQYGGRYAVRCKLMFRNYTKAIYSKGLSVLTTDRQFPNVG